MKFIGEKIFLFHKLQIAFFLLFVTLILSQRIIAQKGAEDNPSRNREIGLRIVKDIKKIVKENYYDPTFHGIDLDKHFDKAEEKIKTLSANEDIFREIANTLLEFNDSHTLFIPPYRLDYVEYGISMQMIGNDCHIVKVSKGSDAEAKQIRPGDKILKIGVYSPTRDNLWLLKYLLYQLYSPASLEITIQGLNGEQQIVRFKAKLVTLKEKEKLDEKRKQKGGEKPYKCVNINSDLIACKLYTFVVENNVINKMMKEIGQHKNLILDLRGNSGGYVKTENFLTGYFFEEDIKIGTEIKRKKSSVVIAKSAKEKTFKGNLGVLIDSDSASASEVFARTIQIEKRGKVIGDQSAGAVMTGVFFEMADVRADASITIPGDTRVNLFYGVNLTIGDLIMSDGNRLEGVGVIPDHLVGPTGQAIYQKTDPILAYAAGLFGQKLTPEESGKYQFLIEKDEN